jgi:hypothetical protein
VELFNKEENKFKVCKLAKEPEWAVLGADKERDGQRAGRKKRQRMVAKKEREKRAGKEVAEKGGSTSKCDWDRLLKIQLPKTQTKEGLEDSTSV